MSLDLSKLQNIRTDGNKTVARCPACAEQGKDRKGDHLVIFPDGHFGCVVGKNAAHRKDIFRLVGVPDAGERAERGPIPVPIRRPAGALRKPRTLRTINFHLLDTEVKKLFNQDAKDIAEKPSETSESTVHIIAA